LSGSDCVFVPINLFYTFIIYLYHPQVYSKYPGFWSRPVVPSNNFHLFIYKGQVLLLVKNSPCWILPLLYPLWPTCVTHTLYGYEVACQNKMKSLACRSL
jgi:hypothetical protein